MAEDLSAFEKLVVEEYKALRAESLSLATAQYNTVWLAVGAFITTVGGALFAKEAPPAGVIAIVLCTQSVAATTIFLSHVWKYVRIGVYIRSRIEVVLGSGWPVEPIFWEHWIASARARALYRISFLLLQSPFVAAVGLYVIWRGWAGWLASGSEATTIAASVFTDRLWRYVLYGLSFINLTNIVSVYSSIRRAETGAESLGLSAIEPTTGYKLKAPVSVVIPVRNDPRLGRTLAVLRRFAQFAQTRFEFVVCGETVLSPEDDIIVEIVNPARKGDCIRAGIRKASHDVVLICDADWPVTADDIYRLLNLAASGKIAWGERHSDEIMYLLPPPLSRRVASRMFRLIVGRLFPELRHVDTQCGVKALRRETAELLVKRSSVAGLAFDVELAVHAYEERQRIVSVPVRWKHDAGSRVRLIPAAVAMLWQVISIRRRSVGADVARSPNKG